MNPRVFDLAEMAGMNSFNRRSDGLYVVGEEVFERFASLLITEVCDILSSYRLKIIFDDGFEYNCDHPIVAIQKWLGNKNA